MPQAPPLPCTSAATLRIGWDLPLPPLGAAGTAAIPAEAPARARTTPVGAMPPMPIVIGVDDSLAAKLAIEYVGTRLLSKGTEVLLAEVADAGAAAALRTHVGFSMLETGADVARHRRAIEAAETSRVLSGAAHVLHAAAGAAAPEDLAVRKLLLPRAAAGPGAALVQLAAAEGASLLVVGSRGVGPLQSAALSLVGLGSTSAYCLHHSPCPVAVLHGQSLASWQGLEPQELQQASQVVVVAVDESRAAQGALRWALEHGVVRPQDQLQIICVTPPLPVPVEEAPLAAWGLAAPATEHARSLLRGAAETARQHQVGKDRLVTRELQALGGASGPAASIVRYAVVEQAGAVVLGARGMGALRRAVAQAIGLGSVSDYVVRHQHSCPVIVVPERGAAATAL